ncbi:MAG: phosphomannomutase/phosphoglucomutase [Lysobacteraceae bacterium]
MAKRKRKQEQEKDPLLAIDPALRRRIATAAAVIAMLVGGILIGQGIVGWMDQRGGNEALQARDRLVGVLDKTITETTTRFAEAIDDRRLDADAAAAAYTAAATRLSQRWPELANPRVFSPGLDEAFADPDAVGWGRMSVLSASLIRPRPAIGLVGHGDALTLGIAAPLREAGKVIGIAYGELPLDLLIAPVQATGASGGFLMLSFDTQPLAQYGDASLRRLAAPVSIGGSAFRLSAAKPEGSDELGDLLKPIGLGALLWALAAVLASRQRKRGDVEEVSETSFAEVLAAEANAPARKKASPADAAPKPLTKVDRSIFRAYDIRGVLGKTLDEHIARLIGQAVGSTMIDQGLREIAVGRDGRLSGPALSAALIDGLREAGCDVIDIGMAPTPVLYFATHHLSIGSGVAVTGSHNPPDYNGFKIMIGGETLSGDAIQALYTRIVENDLHSGGGGSLQTMDMADEYLSRIASDIQLERQLHVVVDAGNGVAGGIGPRVLEAIGCGVEELYCDIDGTFPNHHPDPGDPANLADLALAVARTQADLGIAFDGDGDRLGVVTRSGEVIYPDRLLMLFAQDVLSRNPGASIIYDVKCTGQLAGQVLRHGGSPIMWKTGHSLIKAKMKEIDAELAGEMSGHFFFRERWYGFDDGIYAAARLLEIIAADGREPEEIFEELPKGVSTPELKVQMEEGEHYAFIDAFRAQARFEGAKIASIDGLRADWPDGWGLVRCSNTTPCLVLRFDADSQEALTRIQELFRTQLLAVRADLDLPF